MKKRYKVTLRGEVVEIELTRQGDAYQVEFEGQKLQAALSQTDRNGMRRLTVGDRILELIIARSDGGLDLALEGLGLTAQVEDEHTRLLAMVGGANSHAVGGAVLAAPMPGLVVRVL